MVLPSAFVAAYRVILPSLPRPIPIIITLTLIDLTNNLEYLISPGGSLAGAFLNPFI